MQHEDPYRFVDALVGSDQSSDHHESEGEEPPTTKDLPHEYPCDVMDDTHGSEEEDEGHHHVTYTQNGYHSNGHMSDNVRVSAGGYSGVGMDPVYSYDAMYEDSGSSAGGEHLMHEEHPYLDMDEQRQSVASDRLESHMRWCDSMSEKQRLSLDNRRCALKILINEACLRDRTNTKKEALKVALYYQAHGHDEDSLRQALEDHEREDGHLFASPTEVAALRTLNTTEGIGRLYENVVRCPSPVLMDRYVREILDPEARSMVQEKDSRIMQQWRFIADQVVDDMECFDYSATVLKNLSCMSVFIPENISRDYGENFVARQERLKKMRSLIDDLAMEDRLFTWCNDDEEDAEEDNGADNYEVDNISADAAGVEEGLADSLSGDDDDRQPSAHNQEFHTGSLDEDELLGAHGTEGGSPDSVPTDHSDDYLLSERKEDHRSTEVPLGDEFAFL